jgi:hypothetical protein
MSLAVTWQPRRCPADHSFRTGIGLAGCRLGLCRRGSTTSATRADHALQITARVSRSLRVAASGTLSFVCAVRWSCMRLWSFVLKSVVVTWSSINAMSNRGMGPKSRRADRHGLVGRCGCLASSAYPSPPTEMRAAINVQHLAGDLARLGEIEHGLCDVPGARNLPQR